MAALQFPVPTYPSAESLPDDSPLRKLYPDDVYPNGKYFRSLNGRVRYWIVGPPDGPKVSLIHGISAPSLVFTRMTDEFVKKGFQVLLYDVHGRGYSEAPTEALTTNDYITQLALLLQYVEWTRTYVIGFSMGGGIAAAFTASFPHLVDGKLILIASAGLLDFPIDKDGQRVRPSLNKDSSLEQDNLATQLRRLQAEALPGFLRVVQDSMRSGPIAGLKWAFENLATAQTAKGPLQVLIIHGTNDAVVPFGEAGKIKMLVPQAEVVSIEGAGHYLAVEEGHWQTVTSNSVRFLGTASS